MTIITLFIINSLFFSSSAGMIFSGDSKTSALFGNIYEANVNLFPWQINNIYFGVASDLLYKKSYPYANDFLQAPNLYTRVASFGLGPIIIINYNKAISLGMLFRLNYLRINYPESGNNSAVDYKSSSHWPFGANLFGYFTPLAVKGFNIGLEMGLHVTTYGDEDYYSYYEPGYKLFDHLNIYGFTLKLMIARWR